jgi:hypothetical protein
MDLQARKGHKEDHQNNFKYNNFKHRVRKVLSLYIMSS